MATCLSWASHAAGITPRSGRGGQAGKEGTGSWHKLLPLGSPLPPQTPPLCQLSWANTTWKAGSQASPMGSCWCFKNPRSRQGTLWKHHCRLLGSPSFPILHFHLQHSLQTLTRKRCKQNGHSALAKRVQLSARGLNGELRSLRREDQQPTQLSDLLKPWTVYSTLCSSMDASGQGHSRRDFPPPPGSWKDGQGSERKVKRLSGQLNCFIPVSHAGRAFLHFPFPWQLAEVFNIKSAHHFLSQFNQAQIKRRNVNGQSRPLEEEKSGPMVTPTCSTEDNH